MTRAVQFAAAVVFATTAATLFAQADADRTVRQPRDRSSAPGDALSSFDVTEKSITELQDALTAGRVTSKQLVAAYLARIEAYDQHGPKLNTMTAVNAHAVDVAAALDVERRSKGPRGPLHGIPIVIKDNFETADLPTTGGSIALAGFEPHRDAFMVARLREAGAVIVGKTNLHELAAGILTVSSLGGQTRNPYDLARNPGGSSGGTGAAVAASFAAAGMGSDTCGSIRIPSANNNLVGLRGTAGLSSRRGIIPLSHTQDIGGPLARTVTDLAIMLDATVGFDEGDPTTRASQGHVPTSYREGLKAAALKGKRIGVLKNFFASTPEEAEVGTIDRAALDAMKAAGAEVEDVTVPGLDELLRGSSLINSEFKFDLMDYLAQFPNAPTHSLGEILDRGDYAEALENTFRIRNRPESRDTEESRRAQIKRTAVRAIVLATMEELKLDVLAYPPLPRKAAIIGEPQLGAANCQLSAATGLPAISMPAGFTTDGVPVGIELLGREWTESDLLGMAYAYEQATRPRRAPSTTPPLVNGRPPTPRTMAVSAGPLRVTFTFDPLTNRLRFEATAGKGGIRAAALHRAEDGANGPVVIRLADPEGVPTSGEIVLTYVERQALEDGKLYTTVDDKSGKRYREAVKP